MTDIPPGLDRAQDVLDISLPNLCPWCNKTFGNMYQRRSHQAHCKHKNSESAPTDIRAWSKQGVTGPRPQKRIRKRKAKVMDGEIKRCLAWQWSLNPEHDCWHCPHAEPHICTPGWACLGQCVAYHDKSYFGVIDPMTMFD
jgi:hypothetical protein